jgi:hypothetical protein
MSEQFKVGDIAVGIGFTTAPNTNLNGMECEIIGPLQVRCVKLIPEGLDAYKLCYHVRWADGKETAAHPRNLRRKQPPKSAREIDTLVSWEDCAWKPMHVKLQLAIKAAGQAA